MNLYDKNQIGVVIPTRNRALFLNNLLLSIQENTVKPKKISIVSSGECVKSIVEKFSTNLIICHEHTSLRGQVNQRNIGIERIIEGLEYLVFLDDDVEVDKNFFKNILDFISILDATYQGIGIKITNLPHSKYKFKKIQKFFYEWSDTPGVVLKSGVATEYNFCEEVLEVRWLRGISIWSSKVLKEFKNSELPGDYAALEDLMFSYRIGLRYKLIYNPRIKVTLRETIDSKEHIFNRTYLANQNRYFFVKYILKNNLIYFYLNVFGKIFAQVYFLCFYKKKKINFLILVSHIYFLLFLKSNQKWS